MLDRLFACRKNVLGGASQSVNPYAGSTADSIRKSLHSATSVKLTRSYRTTWEIMQFALAISSNPELEAMMRHGEPPKIIACKRPAGVIEGIGNEIAEFRRSSHSNLAVIANTHKQALRLYKSLEKSRRLRAPADR